MKTITVKLNTLNDVIKFVQEAGRIDSGIIVNRGSITIDGSSLTGMLSLDISKDFIVKYQEEATDFDNFIQQFKINK